VSKFDRLAVWTSARAGSAVAFGLAAGLVLIWLAEGLVISLFRRDFGYFIDDKYQLQINTLTTVITFLLVVLLQYVTDKGDEAVNTKLDVIIGAVRNADDRMAGVERMTADELRDLHRTVIAELEDRGPTP
jgi:low affinity Fe/Cu permease